MPLGVRLAALSVAQVVSWGILYYALIVAADPIADETGWPIAVITLLFSGGLILSAICGLFVGRVLDADGPRAVMTIGAVIGVAGLVVVAVSPNLVVFGLGWLVCGVAQSAVLYQSAFAVVTRRHVRDRQRALTILTLAGGLASTVFAPLVAGLLSVTDWRTTFLVLAGLLAVVTLPLHWFFLERKWAPHPELPEGEVVHTVSTVLRTRRFWTLEVTMVALTVAMYSVTLAVIPLFTERGLTFELAALALGLLGAGQVVGRLLFLLIPRGTTPWVTLMVTCGLAAVLILLLALVPGPAWLLIGIGILAGAVRGAETLIRATAVSDRWGTRNYGAINGAFAMPLTITAALAPATGPLLATGLGSYAVMALVMAGVALVGAALARTT